MTEKDIFGDIRPDCKNLKIATVTALKNWTKWQDDFEFSENFSDLPSIATDERFLDFGKDYSLFRLYDSKNIPKFRGNFRKQLCEIEYPTDLKTIHCVFREIAEDPKLSEKQNTHISIVSKLLCLWKPDKFPMWDTFARNGLANTHGRKRGHCYSEASPESYEIFKKDFYILYSKWKGQLQRCSELAQGVIDGFDKKNNEQFTNLFPYRILDSYLMGEGKKKN